VENHGDCKNVTIIEEIIKNVKTSTMFTEIEHLIKEMIETINKMRRNREINSSSVKDQKRITENEIQELRRKINNHLDKLQENMLKELTTILPSERREHPMIFVLLMFIFCFSFNCIFSTDIGGDRSATIIWACLSFSLNNFISQGFDSTTTSPNFSMMASMVFRWEFILYASFV
jgi:hypothetical protein